MVKSVKKENSNAISKIAFTYEDSIAFHPGYYIKALIEERKMTKIQFADFVGISPRELDFLLAGKIDLSEKNAAKLSKAFNINIDVWLNIQKRIHTSRKIRGTL